MSIRPTFRRVTALVAASLVVAVAACTSDPGERSAPEPTRAPSAQATSPRPSEPATPTTAAPATPTHAAPAAPATSTPLVLAVRATRAPVDLSRSQATAVLSGRVTNWRTLGDSGALLLIAGPGVPAPGATVVPSAAHAVARAAADDRVLAVVPATAIGPEVRVVTVDGVHPLRDPVRYPFRTAGPANGPVVTMTLVGDVMPARRVGRAAAAAGDLIRPFRPTAPRLAAADITVGTLESTLSRSGAPTQGGDSFGADPRVVAGLRLAGFDVLTLADNHAGDYGSRALVETVQRVRAARIATVGAGANAAVAAAPVIVNRKGIKFGFLAFNSIGETPTATSTRPGAVSLRMQPRTGPLNQRDLNAFLSRVRALRPQVDVIVVLPHWGQQYTDRPVADQRTAASALIAAGVDLVIGSHPHWVQGAEIRKGPRGDALIAWSLGNFMFDMDFSTRTQEGVVLELTFWGRELKAADWLPVRIGSDFAPRFVSGGAAQRLRERQWAVSGPPYRPPVSE